MSRTRSRPPSFPRVISTEPFTRQSVFVSLPSSESDVCFALAAPVTSHEPRAECSAAGCGSWWPADPPRWGEKPYTPCNVYCVSRVGNTGKARKSAFRQADTLENFESYRFR